MKNRKETSIADFKLHPQIQLLRTVTQWQNKKLGVLDAGKVPNIGQTP
jgi:hypothetical protein